MTRQGQKSTGKSRAAELASKFRACEVHRREARAVHRALEQLAKHPLPGLDPDATLAELLPAASVLRSGNPREATGVDDHYATVAQVLSKQAVITQALKSYVAERIRSSLLGPAAARSTWQAHTLGARSVRGVVNERVRWLGGCRCAE